MIDFEKCRKSLKHLEQQYKNYLNTDKSLPTLTQEAIAESVIQRFEVFYDCLYKVMKKYMEQELGLPEVPKSPKPLFRLANENNLLSNKIENWLNYANIRIDTTHDYSGEKAHHALEIMGDFINDSIDLYQKITHTSWVSLCP